MITVYYAHCLAIFNTPQEARDIALLQDLGFAVCNPNAKIHDDRVQELKARGEEYMPYFDSLIRACGALAFRALPDGRIPAGIATEIDAAWRFGFPVFELPSGIARRHISVAETWEYLREAGQR